MAAVEIAVHHVKEQTEANDGYWHLPGIVAQAEGIYKGSMYVMCLPQRKENQYGDRTSIFTENEARGEYKRCSRLHDDPARFGGDSGAPATARVAAVRSSNKEQRNKNCCGQCEPGYHNAIKNRWFTHGKSMDSRFSAFVSLPSFSNQRRVSMIVSWNGRGE